MGLAEGHWTDMRALGGTESHRVEAEGSYQGWRARAGVQGHWDGVKGYCVGIVLRAHPLQKVPGQGGRPYMGLRVTVLRQISPAKGAGPRWDALSPGRAEGLLGRDSA